jgi:DNA polymerase-3 subunit beta
MKFVAERDQLLKALQRAQRIADRKATIPILTNVLITARKNGKLSLAATDLDRWVQVEVEAQVAAAGTVTANARAMADFVAGAADGSQVEVEHAKEGGPIVLRAGRARASFATLPAADFPPAKEAEGVELVVDGKAFAAAVDSVAHAQSNESTRYYLNGIYLHGRGASSGEGGEIVLVATNGHCLARDVLAVKKVPDNLPGVILPSRSIPELVALATAIEDGELVLQVSPILVRAEIDGVAFSTKLVDGTFPDYERVIPPPDVAEGFDVGRAELTLAAKRCEAITSDKTHAIKLSPDKGLVQILGRNPDAGEITDEVEASTTTKVPIGINAKYLANALGALGGNTVRVRYADAGAPIAFTDPANKDRLQIVMAMRV